MVDGIFSFTNMNTNQEPDKLLIYIQWGMGIIIIIFPFFFLSIRLVNDLSFYLLLLLSLIVIVRGYKFLGMSFPQMLSQYWPLHLAMASMSIAMLMTIISIGKISFSNAGNSLRLAVFAILFFGFLQLPIKFFRRIQWGLIGGAITCAIVAFHISEGGTVRANFTNGANAVSNLALLIGFLAFMSIGTKTKESRWLVLFKMVALFSSFYTVFLTQSRGSWIVAFFLIGLTCIFFKSKRKVVFVFLFFAAIFISSSLIFSNKIQNRIEDVRSDISLYMDGSNKDTSIGLRFQFWKGSWILFKENPVFGVGKRNYMSEMKKLAEKGVITPDAAVFTYSHNDCLFYMAITGTFGLLALLAVYFVPLTYFMKSRKSENSETRLVAFMGMACSLTMIAMGLTDNSFHDKEPVIFFGIIFPFLFAYLVKSRNEINDNILLSNALN